MNHTLSKQGFILKKTKENLEEISRVKSELTVKPYQPFSFGKKEEEPPYPVYLEDDDNLYLPRFYALEKYGKPKKTKKWNNLDTKITFKGNLRDYQQNIINQSLPKIKDTGGGMISLRCGGGKTVLALYIACQLKKKTLIMVHKTFLLNQWIERIEQFTDAKVGIIMQDKVEVEGKDIVIGMLQSISKDKYDEKLFKQFGLVIFDEAHHAPSRFFSRSLPMIASEYCLALSATPKRSDKLEKIIFWYMGNIVYQEADNVKRDVLVKMYHYKSDNKKFREAKLPYTGEPNLPRTINWITELESRNKLIIDIIEEIIQEDNRHLLILSDRIKHLEELKRLLDERKIIESDFYIGKMKQSDLDKAKDKPVLFGSYAMASEALDIPTLNCLIMTTSRRNIEQSVGRILRTQNSNIQPLIIDFNDELNCFQTQGRGRIKFYQKNDYKIRKILTKEDKILEERELGKQVFQEKINLDEIDFID
jgi:superfamily II DNA or RNA helicase